ncbi:MAG: PAS domain-containing protein [Phycisphaerales bacterium]|nr:PAS domain-containing protein [Phycisphaerales bacterium]
MSQSKPASELLAAMYAHAPMIVVVMTTDGQVLHCNEAATRATGYSESELTGQNFWSLLFPGRLFAQVPRFISAVHPGQLMGKDASLMMRTRDGRERMVAWTHMRHEDANGRKMIVCFGTDLTERLLAADLADKPTEGRGGGSGRGEVKGGREAWTAIDQDESEEEGVDGEVVIPLFVSPPPLPSDSSYGGSSAIQQVHEFLTGIDARMEALHMAFSQRDLADLTTIAAALRDGAQACGLLDFSARAEKLCTAVNCGEIDEVNGLVQKIVSTSQGEEARSQ